MEPHKARAGPPWLATILSRREGGPTHPNVPDIGYASCLEPPLILFCTLAHARPPIDLGIGVRQVQPEFDGRVLSIEALGATWFGRHLAVDASAAVRLPGDPTSGLADFAFGIAGGYGADSWELPIRSDLLAFGLHVDASPWPDPRDPGAPGRRFRMWPHAIAGAELRVVESDTGVVNMSDAADADPGRLRGDPSLSVVVGPAAGLGCTVWYANRVALRLAWTERLVYERAPDFDQDGERGPLAWATSSAVSLTALVRL